MIKKNIEIVIALVLGLVGIVIFIVMIVPALGSIANYSDQLSGLCYDLQEELKDPVSRSQIEQARGKKEVLASVLDKLRKLFTERDDSLEKVVAEDFNQFTAMYNDELRTLSDNMKLACKEEPSKFFDDIKTREKSRDLDLRTKHKRYWVRKKIFNSLINSGVKLVKLEYEKWSDDGRSGSPDKLPRYLAQDCEGLLEFAELTFVTHFYYFLKVNAEPAELYKMLVSVPNKSLEPDINLELAGIYVTQSDTSASFNKADFKNMLLHTEQVLEDKKQEWPALRENLLNTAFKPKPLDALFVFRILDFETASFDKKYDELKGSKKRKDTNEKVD